MQRLRQHDWVKEGNTVDYLSYYRLKLALIFGT